MITTSKAGLFKPNAKYASYTITSTIPTEPKCVIALKHPGWKSAMLEEMDALAANKTWVLVPRTPHMNVVGCRWIFKLKLRSDGSLERLKARSVAKCYHQQEGIDFSETFSPMMKPNRVLFEQFYSCNSQRMTYSSTRRKTCILAWVSSRSSIYGATFGFHWFQPALPCMPT